MKDERVVLPQHSEGSLEVSALLSIFFLALWKWWFSKEFLHVLWNFTWCNRHVSEYDCPTSQNVETVISPMSSASNFRKSSSRLSNVCLQFDLCFDSAEFTSFSVLSSWKNMHLVQSVWLGVSFAQSLDSSLERETKASFRFRDSSTCYNLKLLSLVKQKQKFSNTASLNRSCYSTIRFLCNILTGIWSGVRKLTGIRPDVQNLKEIVDTYGFRWLIMSASVCRQRIFWRYVSYRCTSHPEGGPLSHMAKLQNLAPTLTKFTDQISGNFGQPSRSYGGPKIGWSCHQSAHIL